LDAIADFGTDLAEYRRLYSERSEAKAAMEALDRDAAEKNRLRDILKFEIAEIDAAHLKPGEEEELLSRRSKLQNAEKIAKQSEFAYRALYGNEKGNAALLLEKASLALSQLSGVIPEAAEAAEKLMGMRYEVEDIANTARDYAEDGEGDPTQALNRVEGRLDVITKLRRKYGVDIAAVLAFRNEAYQRLQGLENADEELERLQRVIAAAEKEMHSLSDRLHEARVAAAAALGRDVGRELAFLDMPSVRFAITVTPTAGFGPNGCDEIAFCIATNPGEPMLPLSRIASGGELSRIMLALKSVLNDRDGVQTAVFDEVDTGISGKTALKIGIKLSEIGRKTQVLCVTHSAQIASLAATHFKIAKHEAEGRAYATIAPLDGEGRVAEVARILGGLSVTEVQLQAAAEMIEEGKRYQ
jgi:DNA repair protein RecN (Recombination protein N)